MPEDPLAPLTGMKRTITVVTAFLLLIEFSGCGKPHTGYSRIPSAKALALSLIMYENDHDDRLPPISDTEEVLNLLAPYNHGAGLYIGEAPPEPFEGFSFNPFLKGADAARIVNPDLVPLAFDSDLNGLRAVGFVDGHAKMIPDSDWPAVQRNMRPTLSPEMPKSAPPWPPRKKARRTH